MQICRERAGDQTAVDGVHLAAFGPEGTKVVALARALRSLLAPDRGEALVARVDGQIVGHLMLTPALLDAPRAQVGVEVLSPIGVLPRLQGRGIGTALIDRALAGARAREVPLVFLEGDPRYYARVGFRRASGLGFRSPSLRIPDPAFQVHPLDAHEPWMTGTLVYPDAFWNLDAVGLRSPDGDCTAPRDRHRLKD
jgi:putative acetyltransferase